MDDTSMGTTTGEVAVASLCLEQGSKRALDSVRIADVDGDGTDDFWQLYDEGTEDFPRAHGFQLMGLELAEEPVEVGYFEADALDIADIDGDGRDDLLRLWMGEWEYRRGQVDLTFEAPFVPTSFPPDLAPQIFVDVDGDGDDDAVRTDVAMGGDRISILINEDGVFSLAGTTTVEGKTNAGVMQADVVAGTSLLVLELDVGGLTVLDVLDDFRLVARLGAGRFLGGMTAGDQTVVFFTAGNGVDVIELGADGSRQSTFVESIEYSGAAVADFEGLGSLQVLYRNDVGMFIKRYPDGTEFEVTFEPDSANTRTLPVDPGNYEGLGVLIRKCGFVCELYPARLVEC